MRSITSSIATCRSQARHLPPPPPTARPTARRARSQWPHSAPVPVARSRARAPAGFQHTAFTFGMEANIAKTNVNTTNVPPGALVAFLQKGLQYTELEQQVDAVSRLGRRRVAPRADSRVWGRARGGAHGAGARSVAGCLPRSATCCVMRGPRGRGRGGERDREGVEGRGRESTRSLSADH
jgi:hypothetical protein